MEFGNARVWIRDLAIPVVRALLQVGMIEVNKKGGTPDVNLATFDCGH